ncbi:MAG: glycosyltransferase family 2 protein [Phycisphaeraceae bacterium]|nr:glycosyltransferase family 2 protein [Phycisphaeraceae bacterium]
MSVVIATYNWSEALACALRSVQLQTYQDYEVLVVGDACTDDSAEVVAKVGDSRFRWMNRAQNSGGQWGPNNDGIAASSGEYIAYLGHDDLWYPTHLKSLVRAAERQRADLACAMAIMYGPPETGVRSVTGVFRDGAMDAGQFVVPSSMMHSRALVDRMGPWRDPAAVQMPADCEFVRRAVESGAVFASTDELSVFKFNAAWRRDAYGNRQTTEQRAMLEKIESGVDFRREELTELIRAFVSHRNVEIRMPHASEATAGAMRRTSIYKGAASQKPAIEPLWVARRFTLGDQPASLEWYPPETRDGRETFRWSGPSTISSLRFPISLQAETDIRVHVLGVVDPQILGALRVELNGEPVACAVSSREDGTHVLQIRSDKPSPPGREVSIQIGVPRTTPRPQDPDRRPRGIAVGWVDFLPFSRS